jgi:U3 small nucleolar RNA-associated protein 25
LKNNEKLAHSKERSNVKTDPNVGSKITEDVESIQDQGFTRPTVLILAPFRSSAHAWVTALLKQAPNHQAENSSRFFSEFSLPAGAEDKLSLSSHAASAYPEDHIANMSGNIDDHFRVGIKVTRKSVKIFSDFYSSDIIIASPLGLRNLIDKERYVHNSYPRLKLTPHNHFYI